MVVKDRLQISIDKALKDRVSHKLSLMGLNVSTIVNALFIQIDNLNKVPFDFSLSEHQKEVKKLQEVVRKQPTIQHFDKEEDFVKWYDEKYGDY
jgi:addiction module RelB/DinJ family antitoxin